MAPPPPPPTEAVLPGGGGSALADGRLGYGSKLTHAAAGRSSTTRDQRGGDTRPHPHTTGAHPQRHRAAKTPIPASTARPNPNTGHEHRQRRPATAVAPAGATQTPIDPPTRAHPDLTLDDAYAIQAAWVDLQVANGAEIRGHKIGLTSRAMQQAMNIDEPDFGALLDYMFLPSGGSIVAADYLDPKIEVEFAFVLSDALVPHDLGRDLTPDDVYAATEYIVPALELIDARSHRVHPDDGRTRTVRDTISDNAANAGIVVGSEQIGVESARNGDLRWAGAICSRNGIVEETGLGAGVLDDPVTAVLWLVRRLARYGQGLAAGEVVLSGSFVRPIEAPPGSLFEADFGAFGSVAVGFD